MVTATAGTSSTTAKAEGRSPFVDDSQVFHDWTGSAFGEVPATGREQGEVQQQNHPEAGPGPHDAAYLFEKFTNLMTEAR